MTSTLLTPQPAPTQVTPAKGTPSRITPTRVTPTLSQLATLSTEQVLLTGGDARLAIDPHTHLNKYGCGSHPDPSLAAFGSYTRL